MQRINDEGSFLPNSAGIELVEGCNRMCDFCGLHTVWKTPEQRIVKHMPLELVRHVAASFAAWPGWIYKRMEFAEHGEPTLHPDLLECLATFREALPQAQFQLTTNGLTIMRGVIKVQELFDAGLNILLVDAYVNREAIYEKLLESHIPVDIYYEEGVVNPYHYHDNRSRHIVLMDDLSTHDRRRPARKVINNAGNSDPTVLWRKYGVPPVLQPLNKKCSRPFREIVVHYDGTVPICCIDWRHENIMGDVAKQTFQEVWDGPSFTAARRLLYEKYREMRPCYKCDYKGGFRLGLLPKPDMNISVEQAVEMMRVSLLVHKKYEHENAKDEPLFYTPEMNKGIQRFLKHGK